MDNMIKLLCLMIPSEKKFHQLSIIKEKLNNCQELKMILYIMVLARILYL